MIAGHTGRLGEVKNVDSIHKQSMTHMLNYVLLYTCRHTFKTEKIDWIMDNGQKSCWISEAFYILKSQGPQGPSMNQDKC